MNTFFAICAVVLLLLVWIVLGITSLIQFEQYIHNQVQRSVVTQQVASATP